MAKLKLKWDFPKDTERYERVKSDTPYHTARWTRLSKFIRSQRPLCEECKRNGIIRAGEVVDHIIPWPVCEDFFDIKNLQVLCEKCNHLKGQRDKKLIQKYKAEQAKKT